MKTKPVDYFPDFDALRAIAALSVVFFHITVWLEFPKTTFFQSIKKLISLNQEGGEIGVLFFFVLSGFLITYLMLRERENTESFSIINFYRRRICRIWPLYFFTVFIGFIIYPYLTILFNKPYVETADFWYYLFFLANVNSYTNGFSLGVLGVQWSVAIEEQFYLFWPLLFSYLNRTHFIYVVGILLFISNVFIISNIREENYIYFHSLSAVNELALGGLVAYLAFYKPICIQNLFTRLHKPTVIFLYIIGISFLLFNKEIIKYLPFVVYIRKPLMALFFAFILIEQSYSSSSFFKFRRFNILTYLGKISYGIYLLHMVAIQIILGVVSYVSIPIAIQITGVLALTVLLSHLSYKYLERYFLGMKHPRSIVQDKELQ